MFKRALVALTALLGAVACGDGPTGPTPRIEALPRALTSAEVGLIRSSNGFAFDLLRATVEDPGGTNVFVSPLSVSMALGMTLNGARGETLDSMRATLGFDDLELPEIDQGYQGVLDLLTSLDRNVELAVANSTWSRAGFPFEDEFYQTVTEYFGATVQELDFADPASRDRINGWVADRTHGRIESIVDRIDPTDIMFLVNAVYFNAAWRQRFDAKETAPRPFYVDPGGAPIDVETMSGDLDVGLAYTNDALIGEIPYGGGAFTMVLAVPDEGRSLESLAAQLDADTWAEWMALVQPSEGVRVELPKLEIEYGASLRPALESLGMGIAFGDRADFSGLTPAAGARISRVKHKTFLKVDERGTEAAAATSVAVGLTSGPPSLRVDRPFLLAIRERLSGAVLFIGLIRDPRSSG